MAGRCVIIQLSIPFSFVVLSIWSLLLLPSLGAPHSSSSHRDAPQRSPFSWRPFRDRQLRLRRSHPSRCRSRNEARLLSPDAHLLYWHHPFRWSSRGVGQSFFRDCDFLRHRSVNCVRWSRSESSFDFFLAASFSVQRRRWFPSLSVAFVEGRSEGKLIEEGSSFFDDVARSIVVTRRHRRHHRRSIENKKTSGLLGRVINETRLQQPLPPTLPTLVVDSVVGGGTSAHYLRALKKTNMRKPIKRLAERSCLTRSRLMSGLTLPDFYRVSFFFFSSFDRTYLDFYWFLLEDEAGNHHSIVAVGGRLSAHYVPFVKKKRYRKNNHAETFKTVARKRPRCRERERESERARRRRSLTSATFDVCVHTASKWRGRYDPRWIECLLASPLEASLFTGPLIYEISIINTKIDASHRVLERPPPKKPPAQGFITTRLHAHETSKPAMNRETPIARYRSWRLDI